MEQLERIREMEERMVRAGEAVSALSRALEAYRQVLPDIRILEEYLGGDDWRADFAADEAGLLPPELPRGVLSQDGLYDLLEEHDLLLRRLGEAAEGFPETEAPD